MPPYSPPFLHFEVSNKTKILILSGCVLILAGLAGLIISGIKTLNMYSGVTPDDASGLANEISNRLGPTFVSGAVGGFLFTVGAILLLVGLLLARHHKKQKPIEARLGLCSGS